MNFQNCLINKFSFKVSLKISKKAIIHLSEFLISMANDKQLFILKGYAGTGKTSLMKTLVDNISNVNYKVKLLMLQQEGLLRFYLNTQKENLYNS